MTDAVRPRVLFVDDEENVLQAITRLVRGYVQPEVASSPLAAVALLDASVHDPRGCYAVVVSDMRMPGMDGAELLKHAYTVCPESTRILLTGYADLRSAMSAVNDGNVFRFLTKPCSATDLRNSLAAALEQHQLIVDRRELLDHTLRGAVEALVETLAMAQPAAFARATRLRRLTSEMAAALQLPDAWQVEVAAQLGEIGVMTLPEEALEALSRGGCTDPRILAMLDRLPKIADDVLSRIPRLEAIRAIVREQESVDRPDGQWIRRSLPSRVLQAVREYDANLHRGLDETAVIALLRQRTHHDSTILDALQTLASVADGAAVREVDPCDLWIGAVLAADLRSSQGLLLVTQGQPLTEHLLERLRNHASLSGLAARPVVFAH
jgi:response regulator RpfG family c-di-GMP phosphodiesterase